MSFSLVRSGHNFRWILGALLLTSNGLFALTSTPTPLLAPMPPGGGVLVQSCGPDNYTYCYPDNWDSTVTYQSVNSFPIALLFNSGTMEVCCDEIYVYDGLSTAAPLIYTGNGNSGDLTGLFFASTNPDNALTIVFNSDGSVDCASGLYGLVTLDWTVSCLDCTAPQVTFGVDLDCGIGGFYAVVDITAMGTDPVADITNNGGAPAISASAPGSYVIGPFNLGTQVSVTVENDLNPLCNVISPVLTNAPCPIISCGPDAYTYCFDNSDQSVFVYQSASSLPIGILFQNGEMDQFGDLITIYDGLNQFSPVLYSGIGNFGDLSGLLFTSTNADNALTIVLNMNTFYSCTDGFFTSPWNYLVACYDGCTVPTAAFDVELDCVNSAFFIESNITSLGTASTITITNTGGAPDVVATAVGTYLSGPLPLGTSASVSLTTGSPLCTVTSPSLINGPCPVISCGPDNYTYCYADNWDSTTVYQSANSFPIAILFNSGTMESCCDEIYVYDGLNANAPLIYTGNGNFGDLTGLFFTSTNPDNALTIVWNSDGSVDCASGLYGLVPLDWTVSCLDCTNPEATFTLIPDCIQHAFYVAVNVTNTGTSSTVRLTDTYSGDTLVNIGPGVTNVGPIPFDSVTTVTVLNATNPLCRIFSEVFTYSSDSCVIEACEASQFEYCYANGDTAWFVYESGTGDPITIDFIAGELLVNDYIQVFNGYDQLSGLLYQGNQGGNLAGFTVNSQNANDALTLRIVSSPEGSCATGQSFPPLMWAVGCGQVGVNEIRSDDLNLFPNPTNGTLYLAGGSDMSGMVNVQVLDALGRVVKALPITFIGGQNATIDLSDLDNGNYTMLFSTPNWLKARQVQVMR